MSDNAAATITATPEQELAALVAKVTTLSRVALDLTAKCLDINQELPRVIASQVAAAVAEVTPDADFVRGVPLTPDELDALYPAGTGDYQTWYAVTIGRSPGLYPSSDEADTQVLGVPRQSRRKKTGRLEALTYYRSMYDANLVRKMTEVVPAPAAAPAVASGSN